MARFLVFFISGIQTKGLGRILAFNCALECFPMNISEIITPSRIELNLTLRTKHELLEYLPGILLRNGDTDDIHEVRRVIFERERLMSTGIGYGIALPHGKTNSVKKTTAALITLSSAIDYDSLDGLPVQIIVMLVGKEDQVSTHLKLLSKISRLISSDSFRYYALNATKPEQIHKLLVQADEE